MISITQGQIKIVTSEFCKSTNFGKSFKLSHYNPTNKSYLNQGTNLNNLTLHLNINSNLETNFNPKLISCYTRSPIFKTNSFKKVISKFIHLNFSKDTSNSTTTHFKTKQNPDSSFELLNLNLFLIGTSIFPASPAIAEISDYDPSVGNEFLKNLTGKQF